MKPPDTQNLGNQASEREGPARPPKVVIYIRKLIQNPNGTTTHPKPRKSSFRKRDAQPDPKKQ